MPVRPAGRRRIAPLVVLLALAIPAICSAFGASASAATIRVTSTKDETRVDGAISLREAIASIDAGKNINADVSHTGTYGVNDTIQVPAKGRVYIVKKGELVITKPLKLVGAGVSKSIIDANSSSRILHATTGPLTVTGLTLTRAAFSAGAVLSQGGGAIHMDRGALKVIGCRFTHDSVTIGPGALGLNGGGAIWAAGPVKVTRSTFSRNSATVDGGNVSGGGAILVVNLNPVTLVRDRLSGDAFTEKNGDANLGGGGLYDDGGRIVLTRTTFSGERVKLAQSSGNSGGGAVYDEGGGLTATQVSLIGNRLAINPGVNSSGGGALYDDGGSGDVVTLTDTTVARNKATLSPSTQTSGGGGGIFSGGGPVKMVNSTLSYNALTVAGGGDSSDGGGGLTNYGPGQFTNTTIARNTANVQGGGLFGNASFQTLKNSILAGNRASAGANCAGTAFMSAGYNIEDANTCGLVMTGDLRGTNPLLGPLRPNGGPTMTLALIAGSPAIDRIPKARCVSSDQRGKPRPDRHEHRCDSGAYEFQD